MKTFSRIFLAFSLLSGFLLGYFSMHFWGEELFLKGEVLSSYYVASDGSFTDDPSLKMTPTPTPTPTPKPTKTPRRFRL